MLKLNLLDNVNISGLLDGSLYYITVKRVKFAVQNVLKELCAVFLLRMNKELIKNAHKA